MNIVPVIDVMGGQAVHARGGNRDQYQALKSRFASDADPLHVVAGMRHLLDFSALYLADLDAIVHGSPNTTLIRELATAHPDIRLFVDGGFGPEHDPGAYLACANIDVVLATECLRELDDYAALCATVPAQRRLLSLDHGASGRLGHDGLFERPELWPRRLIHMNLAFVGSGGGPDFAGLAQLLRRARGHDVFAAGGVRDRADLARLAALGVHGALVGSALHDNRLGDPSVAAQVDSD